MGWYQYYQLLEKYNGDFREATYEEKLIAAHGNPNNATDALALAHRKWDEKKAAENTAGS